MPAADSQRRGDGAWPYAPSPATNASTPRTGPSSCVDQAGWHVAHDLAVPDGIDLVLLPAQSPELQPVERLWALVDEPIANRAFPDLDALEAVLVDRCRTLEADPDRLKAHARFHWWPPDPAPNRIVITRIPYKWSIRQVHAATGRRAMPVGRAGRRRLRFPQTKGWRWAFQ